MVDVAPASSATKVESAALISSGGLFAKSKVVNSSDLMDAVIRQVTEVARHAKIHSGNTGELSAKEFLDEIARKSTDLAQKYDNPAPVKGYSLRS